jgi:hypothetical protein
LTQSQRACVKPEEHAYINTRFLRASFKTEERAYIVTWSQRACLKTEDHAYIKTRSRKKKKNISGPGLRRRGLVVSSWLVKQILKICVVRSNPSRAFIHRIVKFLMKRVKNIFVAKNSFEKKLTEMHFSRKQMNPFTGDADREALNQFDRTVLCRTIFIYYLRSG